MTFVLDKIFANFPIFQTQFFVAEKTFRNSFKGS